MSVCVRACEIQSEINERKKLKEISIPFKKNGKEKQARNVWEAKSVIKT